jgi:hypothetical protein
MSLNYVPPSAIFPTFTKHVSECIFFAWCVVELVAATVDRLIRRQNEQEEQEAVIWKGQENKKQAGAEDVKRWRRSPILKVSAAGTL